MSAIKIVCYIPMLEGQAIYVQSAYISLGDKARLDKALMALKCIQ